MYGRMYLLRGPVSQYNHKLVCYPCESILRCSIARLAHFNACAMNQARTQTFENGGGEGVANIKYLTVTGWGQGES